MNESDKFDLSTNTWTEIAQLPANSTHNSASVLNNRIYIVGLHLPKLTIYNELSNKYEFLSQMPGCCYKLIYDKWIFISGLTSVYEIKGNKISKYKCSNLWISDPLLHHQATKHEDYIYFIQNGPVLLRFDILSKKIITLVIN